MPAHSRLDTALDDIVADTHEIFQNDPLIPQGLANGVIPERISRLYAPERLSTAMRHWSQRHGAQQERRLQDPPPARLLPFPPPSAQFQDPPPQGQLTSPLPERRLSTWPAALIPGGNLNPVRSISGSATPVGVNGAVRQQVPSSAFPEVRITAPSVELAPVSRSQSPSTALRVHEEGSSLEFAQATALLTTKENGKDTWKVMWSHVQDMVRILKSETGGEQIPYNISETDFLHEIFSEESAMRDFQGEHSLAEELYDEHLEMLKDRRVDWAVWETCPGKHGARLGAFHGPTYIPNPSKHCSICPPKPGLFTFGEPASDADRKDLSTVLPQWLKSAVPSDQTLLRRDMNSLELPDVIRIIGNIYGRRAGAKKKQRTLRANNPGRTQPVMDHVNVQRNDDSSFAHQQAQIDVAHAELRAPDPVLPANYAPYAAYMSDIERVAYASDFSRVDYGSDNLTAAPSTFARDFLEGVGMPVTDRSLHQLAEFLTEESSVPRAVYASDVPRVAYASHIPTATPSTATPSTVTAPAATPPISTPPIATPPTATQSTFARGLLERAGQPLTQQSSHRPGPSSLAHTRGFRGRGQAQHVASWRENVPRMPPPLNSQRGRASPRNRYRAPWRH